MPVWFAVVDRTVYTGTRGKKLVRVRNDPRAAFLVESGDRWAELKAVHVTGRARVLEEISDELRERIDAELDRKYAAYRTAKTDMPSATRTVYATAERKFDLIFVEYAERKSLEVAGVRVTPFEVHHPSGAPPYALRFDLGGKVIAFTGDTGWVEVLCEDVVPRA